MFPIKATIDGVDYVIRGGDGFRANSTQKKSFKSSSSVNASTAGADVIPIPARQQAPQHGQHDEPAGKRAEDGAHRVGRDGAGWPRPDRSLSRGTREPRSKKTRGAR